MKICYFGTYEENYPRNQILIRSLKKMGHAVQECHISLWGKTPDKSKQLSTLLVKCKLAVRLASIYPRLFLKYPLRERPDLFFVGYIGHLDVLFLTLFNKIFGRKTRIVFDAFLSLYDTVVGDRGMVKEGTVLARLLFWIDKTACQWADAVLLDTDAHRDFFAKMFHLPREKMFRVLASADPDLFIPRERKNENEPFRVLFIGKYTPLQGIEHIVEAAAILNKEKEIRFTFIGKGQVYDRIRRTVAGKKLENIEFIEWVKYECLPKYIAQADVCLGIFADSEKACRVIPNKVFQSLAMAKPVITGRTAACAEALEDGKDAILCNPADPVDLAGKILNLKQNQRLGEQVSSHLEKIFDQQFGETAVKLSLGQMFEALNLT